MADHRDPPPLFADDDNLLEDSDSGDIFTDAAQPKPASDSTKAKTVEEDLFKGGSTEVVLDDSPKEESSATITPSSEEKATVSKSSEEPTKLDVTSSTVVNAPKSYSATVEANSKDEEEEEEEGDQFSMEITVTDPKKVGDGMGAYVVYKCCTRTTMPTFKKPETTVNRRFSDFLGLHSKLSEKHQNSGRIIPPAPEKSVIGMTKIKVSKEEASSQEFLEKRRAALERYLNRTAKHPILRTDPDFREFLEQEGDLPKSTSTSALSGAGVMRLFNKMGDAMGKITFKMNETDQWFEDKQQQIESLDQQLCKLHNSIEALVMHRKELASNTGIFAKSAAMLGNAEEHTALSRALSQLAEVEEKLDQLHMDQADSDFFIFSELIKDYVALIGAVKEVFQERVKIFKTWKDAELMLSKKREVKAKLELARKMDKIPAAAQEVTEWEKKVEKGQEEFETISKNIRKEMIRFDKQRVRDFKATIINYLESLMNNQQQVIKHWESFVPEAKAVV